MDVLAGQRDHCRSRNWRQSKNWRSSLMLISVGVLCALMFTQSGCSLFVMAGKTLMGDPKTPSLFSQKTRVKLEKDDKRVVVLCTIPEFLRADFSAVDRDIVDHVTRRFKIHGVQTVPTNQVDRWLSQNGGFWDDPSDAAQEFTEADYIIHFDLDSMSYHEQNSPGMFRGRSQGNVYVYEAREVNDVRAAFVIFEHEFNSTYPRNYPISEDSTSERTFQERYVTRVADELARLFYDHVAGDDVY